VQATTYSFLVVVGFAAELSVDEEDESDAAGESDFPESLFSDLSEPDFPLDEPPSVDDFFA
jgi:hypothetical protein